MTLSNESNNGFTLFGNSNTVYIYVSENENSAVHIATQNLLRDMGLVCGSKAVLSKDLNKCSIIIGTIGNNEAIMEVIKDNKLSVEKLKMEDGSFHWEAYLHEVVDGVLYIIGTDRRGSIFGIYDLCEEMGVSPWHYLADVPIKKKDKFCIPQNYLKVHPQPLHPSLGELQIPLISLLN